MPGDPVDHLHREQRPDQPGRRAERRRHGCVLRAVLHELVVERKVPAHRALLALEAGGAAGHEGGTDPHPRRELAGGDVRHAQLEAGAVHPAPDLVHRPVRGADHEVRPRCHGAHVLDTADTAGQRHEVDLGIQRSERFGGHVDLASAHVGHPVQHLPVQVAQLDRVVVHRDDAPHAGACQPRHGPRPEAARAEHQHGRVAQRELHVGSARPGGRLIAEVVQLPVVAEQLGGREAGRGRIDSMPRPPRRPPPAPRWPRSARARRPRRAGGQRRPPARGRTDVASRSTTSCPPSLRSR